MINANPSLSPESVTSAVRRADGAAARDLHWHGGPGEKRSVRGLARTCRTRNIIFLGLSNRVAPYNLETGDAFDAGGPGRDAVVAAWSGCPGTAAGRARAGPSPLPELPCQ